MRTPILAVLQRVLVGLIACAFLYPLFCVILLKAFTIRTPLRSQLLNTTLNNVPKSPEPPAVDALGILKGTWQRACGDALNTGFHGRELLIRWTNEFYFQALRQSPLADAKIVVGRNGQLYERYYLDNFAFERHEADELRPLVEGLKKFQDALKERGIAFVFLVTPSKAAIYPEDVPEPWKSKHDPRPHSYEVLLPLLDEFGIHYVDGHRITLSAKEIRDVPVFAKGGTHWGDYAMWQTGSAVIKSFREQGKSVPEWEPYCIRTAIVPDPKSSDTDLITLMNIAIPWKYPVDEIDLQPVQSGDCGLLSLFSVGGSFWGGLSGKLTKCNLFSEIQEYSYYKGGRWIHGSPLTRVTRIEGMGDLESAVLGADCCLLEMNEAMIRPAQHIRAFLADALPMIEGAPLGKRQFPFLSYVPWPVDENVQFTKDGLSEEFRSGLAGFSVPEQNLTWTEGPLASIRMKLNEPASAFVLNARLRAFIPGGIRQQRVTVLLGGREIAHWSVGNEPGDFDAEIPMEAAERGVLALSFQISNPARPSDQGKRERTSDDRKLGVAFETLRLEKKGSVSAR